MIEAIKELEIGKVDIPGGKYDGKYFVTDGGLNYLFPNGKLYCGCIRHFGISEEKCGYYDSIESAQDALKKFEELNHVD